MKLLYSHKWKSKQLSKNWAKEKIVVSQGKKYVLFLPWVKNYKFDIWRNNTFFIPGVQNSNQRAGLKYFFAHTQGPKWYVFTHSKGEFIKKHAKKKKIWANRAKLKSSGGHIWPVGRMLCMSALYCSFQSELKFFHQEKLVFSHTGWFFLSVPLEIGNISGTSTVASDKTSRNLFFVRKKAVNI